MGFILGSVCNGEDTRGLLALSLSMPLLGEEKCLSWRRRPTVTPSTFSGVR